jgi:hypothetical protein
MRDIFRPNITLRVKVARQTKETGRKIPGRPRMDWRKRSVGRRNYIRTTYEDSIRSVIGGRWQPCQKNEVPTKNAIGGCRSGQRSHLGRRGTRKKTPYETVNVKITKRITKFTAGLLPVKNRTLWRGRPSPKRKKGIDQYGRNRW